MDLEYILQSDKLLLDQKNKWKELDEFFKTNSKYYKSIDNDLQKIVCNNKPLFVEVLSDHKQKIYDSFKDL